MLVQPIPEPPQSLGLAPVHLRVAAGVVADEHLREVGVEALDVRSEVLPVLEVELLLAALLDRHGELDAPRLRLFRDPGRARELLVDEHARHRGIRAAFQRRLDALEDQVLRVGDALEIRRRRVALEAEALRE